MAALDIPFGGFGLLERDFRSKSRVGVEAGPKLLAAVEVELRQFHRRKLFGFDAFGEFADGEKENLFAGHWEAPQGFVGAAAGFAEAGTREAFFSRSIKGFK